MNINFAKQSLLIAISSLVIAGCSTAKLEARLEANPQCKDVVNPKTGALMPCPGSDKAFYREVGLAPTKTSSTEITPAGVVPVQPIPTSSSLPADCKPQIHKKTGGTLPCAPID